MLFGEFLFLKCLVDEEVLLDVLCEQVRSRPLLGELAVREGLMSAWDAYRVMNEQTQGRSTFGETAARLGLLEDAELERLEALQAECSPKLGEILVRRGVLDEDHLADLLAEFEALQRRSRRKRSA